ncbi:MAG: type IV toxin-antitoxin system AbiEi family antitoxin domain-containing protein [Polaromonas sp.]|uniref:type IV toxin-antitoxin system AbiEi family antitoxin domain-containing protein n=1 Tax=Polaromonas sp. TaxID=1869339 RepID=UPI0027339F53|nr:type IV toxin-antitoxin system AbiEi family antitoxin domain-containing protein [Polaromonas sp.]MDP3247955.1 type IV toxin-antitoxin system AbiEi family antitoxin domain-containing protein [Polaromonas sp.]
MGTSPSAIFRSLLSELPRGHPLTIQWFAERGLAAKQVARLAHDGWLKRVGHGVYILSGDQLEQKASLALLARSIPGLHVGGKTALEWRGVRHNLSARPTLSLWGDAPQKLPAWFSEAFPAVYQAAHIFSGGMPADLGVSALPGGHSQVLVSTPERAMLELLSDVGKRQGLEEATHLLDGLRSPRLNVLEQLFAHLERIKVARLAQTLSEELDLPWKDIARHHSDRLGGGQRWVANTRTGDRLDLRRPT